MLGLSSFRRSLNITLTRIKLLTNLLPERLIALLHNGIKLTNNLRRVSAISKCPFHNSLQRQIVSGKRRMTQPYGIDTSVLAREVKQTLTALMPRNPSSQNRRRGALIQAISAMLPEVSELNALHPPVKAWGGLSLL